MKLFHYISKWTHPLLGVTVSMHTMRLYGQQTSLPSRNSRSGNTYTYGKNGIWAALPWLTGHYCTVPSLAKRHIAAQHGHAAGHQESKYTYWIWRLIRCIFFPEKKDPENHLASYKVKVQFLFTGSWSFTGTLALNPIAVHGEEATIPQSALWQPNLCILKIIHHN